MKRFNLALYAIAAAAVLVLAMTGPDDAQAERDTQAAAAATGRAADEMKRTQADDLAFAKAQFASEARGSKR
jgi:hypothetical protein